MTWMIYPLTVMEFMVQSIETRVAITINVSRCNHDVHHTCIVADCWHLVDAEPEPGEGNAKINVLLVSGRVKNERPCRDCRCFIFVVHSGNYSQNQRNQWCLKCQLWTEWHFLQWNCTITLEIDNPRAREARGIITYQVGTMAIEQ